MFHVSDNLYVGRLPDGSVRMLKFKSPTLATPDVHKLYSRDVLEFEYVLQASHWASVVASVSLQGEAQGRFYVAQAFHMNPALPPNEAEPMSPLWHKNG